MNYYDVNRSLFWWVQNSQIGDCYRAADTVIMSSRWEALVLPRLKAFETVVP